MTFGLLLSLVTGAIGWLGLKFLFEPLKEIWDLRAEMQELLVLYGNLRPDASAELRSEAGQGFRRVGAKLVSRHLSAWPWNRRLSEWRFGLRLDIYSAGDVSMGLGEKVLDEGYSYPNLGPPAPTIRQCLRLPVVGHTKIYEQVMADLQRPAPYEDDAGCSTY